MKIKYIVQEELKRWKQLKTSKQLKKSKQLSRWKQLRRCNPNCPFLTRKDIKNVKMSMCMTGSLYSNDLLSVIGWAHENVSVRGTNNKHISLIFIISFSILDISLILVTVASMGHLEKEQF